MTDLQQKISEIRSSLRDRRGSADCLFRELKERRLAEAAPQIASENLRHVLSRIGFQSRADVSFSAPQSGLPRHIISQPELQGC